MQRRMAKWFGLAVLVASMLASRDGIAEPRLFRIGQPFSYSWRFGTTGFAGNLHDLAAVQRLSPDTLRLWFHETRWNSMGPTPAIASDVVTNQASDPVRWGGVQANEWPTPEAVSLDGLPDGAWDADGFITARGLATLLNRIAHRSDQDNGAFTPDGLRIAYLTPEQAAQALATESAGHPAASPTSEPRPVTAPAEASDVPASEAEAGLQVARAMRGAKRVRTPQRPAARPTADTTFRDALRHDVIGQDEAIEVVVRTLNRARAGLGDPNRPRGSFLFAGPSGRGKSELGKAIAAHLGEGYVFRQFDMAEFSNEESVSRLFGGDPNYVGFDEGGELSNALADNPKTVVLFDEIEKAHPNVVNSLLGVIEDGNVRDGRDGGGRGQSKPRKATAREAVLILTTNAGRKVIGNRIAPGAFGGEDDSDLRRALAASGDFRPELVNRPDAVALFHDLTPEAVEQIAALRVEGVARRLASRNIHLQLTDRAKAWLAVRGFDADFGMRPLGRLVAREITDQVADGISAGWIEEGDTVHLTFEGNDGLTVRTAREVAELDEYEHAIGTRTLGRTTRAAAQARSIRPVRTPRAGLLGAPRTSGSPRAAVTRQTGRRSR